MSATSPRRFLLSMFTLFVLLATAGAAAHAEGEGGGSGGGGGGSSATASPDANPGTAATIRNNYFKRYKWAKEFNDADHVQNGESQSGGNVSVPGPIFVWPKKVQGNANVSVPTQRDTAIGKHLVKTFGYPVSDTQFQIIQRLDDNMMLEEAFDPERRMWMESAMGAIKATSAANSVANLGRNQSAGAITFAQSFLRNFANEAGNVWQRMRNELFVPMAVLLLIPGAVLAQVRAIVAQGFPVLGEVNPFEGILRSIVAIFLIPASYLVISYGIDVSNAITKEMNEGYRRIAGGGGDMYKDAICAQKRAFPIRKDDQNKNAIPSEGGGSENSNPVAAGADVFAGQENLSFDVGITEDCDGGGGGQGGQNAGSDQNADELSPVLKSTQRLVVNAANAGLSSTWNVLCAFQMAYLYYLWCMGPIVAALWVWPIGQLRGALPSWCEGVITLCFWSLFWNTTILLMACFKGVGETGTIIMTALNFLSINCVKHAFDFSGLVKAAGEQAGKMASKGGGGGGGGGGGKGQGTPGHGQTTHGPGPGGTHAGPGGTQSPGAPQEAGPKSGRGEATAPLASAMMPHSGPGVGHNPLAASPALPSSQSGGDSSTSAMPSFSGPGPGGADAQVNPGGSDSQSLPPTSAHSGPGGGHSAGVGGGPGGHGGSAGGSSGGGPGGGFTGGDAGGGTAGSDSAGAPGGFAGGSAPPVDVGVQGGPPSASDGPPSAGYASGSPVDAVGYTQSAGYSYSAADSATSAASGSAATGSMPPDSSTYSSTSAGAYAGSTDSPPPSSAAQAPPGGFVADAGAVPGTSGVGGAGAPGGPPSAGVADAGPIVGSAPPPPVTVDNSTALPPQAATSLPEALAVYYPDSGASPPPVAEQSYSSSTQYYREEQVYSSEQYSSYPSAPVQESYSAPAAQPEQQHQRSESPASSESDSGSPKTLYATLGRAGSPRPESSSPADATPAEKKQGSLMEHFKKPGSVKKVSRETKEWKARSLEDLQRLAQEQQNNQ